MHQAIGEFHDPTARTFVSDNAAGVHPAVLAAIAAVDGGHQLGYGADLYTDRLRRMLRAMVGSDIQVLPVLNGTGANILGLELLTSRGDTIVCSEHAHLVTSESGAPALHGLSVLPVHAPDGRIEPKDLARALDKVGRNDPRPTVLSLSQTTELGTCYSHDHRLALIQEARARGLRIHLDGARLANAAAHLDAGLGDLLAGADVACFGVSKNGGMLGEVVVIQTSLDEHRSRTLHKALGQLPAKTRFVSAQLLAMLDGDLWVHNALQANTLARRLDEGLAEVPNVRVVLPVEANAVFVELSPDAWARLRERHAIGEWYRMPGVARLMTAFDTTESDVEELVALLSGE